MKGYRFYLEHASNADKRKGKHTGNVVAVPLDERGREYWYPHAPGTVEAISAVFSHPNSDVASGGVDFWHYIRGRCKRISETRAREVHPKLMAWLDSFKDED